MKTANISPGVLLKKQRRKRIVMDLCSQAYDELNEALWILKVWTEATGEEMPATIEAINKAKKSLDEVAEID